MELWKQQIWGLEDEIPFSIRVKSRRVRTSKSAGHEPAMLGNYLVETNQSSGSPTSGEASHIE